MRTDRILWRSCGAGWIVCLTSLLLSGCGYPTVSSDAYDVAKALHNAILQRDAASLPRAEVYIAAAAAEGRITASESQMFAEHIDAARAGDWDGAAARLRSLLTAQNVEE